jgi:hypothetical protein
MAKILSDKDKGTRYVTGDPPPDVMARLDAMNSTLFGNVSGNPATERAADYIGPPVGGIGTVGGDSRAIEPPGDVGKAASTLAEIFAPEANVGAAVAPSVSSSTPSGAVATPVEAMPAPVSPAMEAAGQSPAAKNINGWIKELMQRLLYDGGMGDELRMDLRNQATNVAKMRERDRILRRSDEFAARGLFGGGQSKNAVMGIEAQESQTLQTALNEIEFQDAQMKAQSLRDAIQALNAQIAWKLGKGQLNVAREQMALQKLMHAEQMALNWAQFNWQKLQDQAGGYNPGMENPAANATVGDNPPIPVGGDSTRGGNLFY